MQTTTSAFHLLLVADGMQEEGCSREAQKKIEERGNELLVKPKVKPEMLENV